jgi:hypothetical protein
MQSSSKSGSLASNSGNEQPQIGETLDKLAAEDDIDYSIWEYELHLQQKVNLVASINSMRMSPVAKSRMRIPLCRMVFMPMVQPTLDSDLKKLGQEFVHGYWEGTCVFYVSLINETGEECFVSEEDKHVWGPLWDQQSEVFNMFVDFDPNMVHLKNRMFYVCDGNHRLLSWMGYIWRLHNSDIDWHYLVDSIVLDTKGKTSIVLSAMHNINRLNLNHFFILCLFHVIISLVF